MQANWSKESTGTSVIKKIFEQRVNYDTER